MIAVPRSRPLLLFATLTFLLGPPGAPADPAPAAAARPTVAVSPTTVVRGGSVLVTGRRWAPRATVQLLIGPPRSEADPVATVRTTSAGTFRRRLPIAAGARTGRFVLLACRRSCRIKASASFRIVAPAFAGALSAGALPAR
ncbi:MAG: hypothetical protein MUF56_04845 [Solirubrobacteraceae bacterium]|nr:hypothetical protein [Solirubrobacteraceae bacterium]